MKSRPAAAAQRADEVQQRDRAEQGKQRVGPGLLGVPEQHRVDRDQRRGGEPGAAAAQLVPIRKATGTVATPARAESERRPNSPVPVNWVQSQASA